MTITNNPFVRTKTEARGFALYVGIDEVTAAELGTSLAEIVIALRKTLDDISPGLSLETFAALALAKEGSGGRNIDVVKTALGDPRVIARLNESYTGSGVVVDLARRKVLINGIDAELSPKEFQILSHLVENLGETIHRDELIDALWSQETHVEGRTVDVNVRRLREKLGRFGDIVRTIRGEGYRFDEHPDVSVEGN
jgi:DNA-binding response OmpR family regulator